MTISRSAARIGTLLTVLATLLLASPHQLLAHLQLLRTVPANGATVTAPPSELRLTFTERPQLALSALRVTGPAGRIVDLGAPHLDSTSAHTLVVSLPPALSPGQYVIEWRTASADGHPAHGRFHFTIAPAAPGSSAAAATEAAGDTGSAMTAPTKDTGTTAAEPPEAGGFGVRSPFYVSVRWVGFVALLAIIGAGAFARFIAPRAAAESGTLVSGITGASARAGVLAALILGIDSLLRLAAEALAMRQGGMGSPSLGALVTGSVWGWGWLIEVAGVILAIVGFRRARATATRGWRIVTAAALLLTLSFALSGHAAAVENLRALSIVADMAHVFGAGGWIGSLLMLGIVGIPAAMHEPEGQRGRTVAILVHAFSPFALACATLLVLAGVTSAWMHLGTLPALWRTDYGRVLLIKLAFVACVVALGFLHWRMVRPKLGSDEAGRRIRRSIVLELVFAALVLAATAVLVATPPPAEAGAVATHSASR